MSHALARTGNSHVFCPSVLPPGIPSLLAESGFGGQGGQNAVRPMAEFERFSPCSFDCGIP